MEVVVRVMCGTCLVVWSSTRLPTGDTPPVICPAPPCWPPPQLPSSRADPTEHPAATPAGTVTFRYLQAANAESENSVKKLNIHSTQLYFN